ncbi:hypothetical protein BaRGS_00027411 [Batillaria attramentaria]|uniref:Uncharacterized protein n=1 Tax=Batillaria attramentaria TaxID=370345 RepID=A0ABD0K2U3_9CAEN
MVMSTQTTLQTVLQNASREEQPAAGDSWFIIKLTLTPHAAFDRTLIGQEARSASGFLPFARAVVVYWCCQAAAVVRGPFPTT